MTGVLSFIGYLVCVMYCFNIGATTADLRISPQVTLWNVGDTVRIICSKVAISESTVNWKYRSVGSSDLEEVYSYIGSISVKYQGKFAFHSNDSTGTYEVEIKNVKAEFAGTFLCVDSTGLTASAELIVLESPPTCSSNVTHAIGENLCDIEIQTVGLSCSVAYRGNVPPVMAWVNSRSNDVISYGLPNVTSANTAVYSNTVKATSWMDKSYFICRLDSKHSCSTKPVQVSYLVESTDKRNFSTPEGSFSCSVNTSDDVKQCTYTWKRQSGEVFQQGQVVQFTGEEASESNGIFQCYGECRLQGVQCTVKGTRVFVNRIRERVSHAVTVLAVIVGILGFLVLALAIILILFCYIKLRHSKCLESCFGKSTPLPLDDNIDPGTPLNPFKPDGEATKLKEINTRQQRTIDELNKDNKSLKDSINENKAKADKENNRIKAELEATKALLKTAGCDACRDTLDNLIKGIHQTGTMALKSGRELMGVAQLDGRIYIIYSDVKKIGVHNDFPPFLSLMSDEIVIKDVEKPDDMASCSATKCLFISDYSGNECIFKVQMPDKTISRYKVNGKPSKISTTANDELVTIVRGQTSAFLEIYQTSTGQFLKKVNFPIEMKLPIKAFKLATGRLVVLYGGDKLPDKNQRRYMISETSDDGQIIRTFDFSTNDTTSDLIPMPSHLAVDENGKMFVADSDHARILVIDSDLTACQILAMTDQPYRLSYAREKRLLIVGKWSPASMTLFSMASK